MSLDAIHPTARQGDPIGRSASPHARVLLGSRLPALVTWAALACAAAGGGCTEIQDQPTTVAANGCVGCHGDSTGPAPLDEVHQTHLHASALFEAVECGACHIVPTRSTDEGHADTGPPAEVVFSPAVTATGALAPTYEPATRSCSNVSCHGAGLSAPADRPLRWEPPEPSDFYCAGCHSAPRTESHPTVVAAAPASCEQCHGVILASTHIDGEVELALPTDCSACHGDATSPAPVDILHRTHVLGSGDGKPVECAECHVVPATTGAQGHLDAAPAEVTFGTLASTGGTPEWNGRSCAGTYCHSGRAGAETPAPKWTDTTELGCDSCHGSPPAQPHPAVEACSLCHGEVVNADLAIVAPERHVDGTLDQNMPTDCGGCHGSPGSPAPLDAGHTTHLVAAASVSAAMDCEACHIVPAEPLAPGHLDAPPADVTFGDHALLGGANPTFAGGTCASTYCHGSAEPTWGDTSGAFTACDSCHGSPPAAPHLPSGQCDACHADVIAKGPVIKAPSLHIDGVVETVTPACNACHGDATTNAPDQGAHLTHIAFGFDCSECHVVPSTYADEGHLDGAEGAEVAFGALADARLHVGQWDVSDKSCASTYCHAATPDAALPAPEWDATDGAAKACGACHAMPPATTPVHDDTSLACTLCHKAFPDKHVNGLIDFIP